MEYETKIVGESRRALEEEVPNVGITGSFDALFSRPISARVALYGLMRFELGWGWSLGMGGRGVVRALYVKKRQNRLSHDSGRPNGAGGGRVGGTGRPLATTRGEPLPSEESRGGDLLFGRWWRKLRAAETAIDSTPGGNSGGGLASARPCQNEI